MEIVEMATAGTTPITPGRLMQFTFGFAPPLIIEAAIRHGVFNVLDQGAKSLEAERRAIANFGHPHLNAAQFGVRFIHSLGRTCSPNNSTCAPGPSNRRSKTEPEIRTSASRTSTRLRKGLDDVEQAVGSAHIAWSLDSP
jgi:hypothetical protein